MYADRSQTPSLRQRVRDFFFAEEVPFGLALVRILLPLVLLLDVTKRWGWCRELYSADGAPAQLSLTYGWGYMLPELPGALAVALFTMLAFCLLATSIGWCTRFAVTASFVLYTYFSLMDSISTITKYTVIASHALLLLSVSECGSVWSIDAWLARRRRNHWPGLPAVDRPKSAAWPRRLMQLMIGYVYFGAAITKMHTPEYFSGDQLWHWVNTYVNHGHPIGEYFNFAPWLLGIFSYVAIIWEVLFLFLVWRGLGRGIMLTLGVAFHLGTTLILGLYIFPLVCITIYLSFANEDDIAWAARHVRRRQRRFARRSSAARSSRPKYDWDGLAARIRHRAPVAFAVAVVAVSVAGVQVEHLADPYGRRRAEGPYSLKPISDARAHELLLSGTGRIEHRDKVLTFDIGTTTVGGMLARRKETYRIGDCMLAQCTFNPPHEDMWVQCVLQDVVVDEHGRPRIDPATGLERLGTIIDEQGQGVTRSELRTNFGYSLADTLEPGWYAVVLKIKNGEVARRIFRVLPNGNTPARPNPVAMQ